MQRGVGTEESITAWLQDWTDGDREAGEQLFALVYPELKKLAGRFLARERAGAPEIGTWHSGWRLAAPLQQECPTYQ